MVTNRQDFWEHYKNDLEFKSKVILGHILISKVFLHEFFLEYYVNFLKDRQFDKDAFLKSVGYIDIMLDGDNYTDRYSRFEENWDIIANTLKNDTEILYTLKKSIMGDIINIIWKKNESWILVNPYNMEFLDDIEWIKIVQQWIRDYIKEEKNKLTKILSDKKIKELSSWFLSSILEILSAK